jgi:hypothetical protein
LREEKRFFLTKEAKTFAAWLALFVAVFWTAAKPAVAGALVVASDPGTYAVSKAETLPNPSTTSGEQERGLDAPRLLQRTTHICAHLHTRFGLQFTLSPDIGVEALPVFIIVTHPPMANHTGQIQTEDAIDSELKSGEKHFSGWSFLDPGKLLGGRWHISVLHGGQTLADQPFDVDFACAPAIS